MFNKIVILIKYWNDLVKDQFLGKISSINVIVFLMFTLNVNKHLIDTKIANEKGVRRERGCDLLPNL